MKVLIGTTNPSKADWLGGLIGAGTELLTLGDVNISAEPSETGATPAENAAIKAEFYGKTFQPVVCHDSGLYFAELALDDPRQPGLHVRTPNGRARFCNDEEMLAYYDLSTALPEVKAWYDGYLFNRIEIYNPWSILKYVNDRKDHVTQFALPYWSNTSSNSIIREMVGEADEEAKEDLETLINGGTIEKRVHEDITYGDIHQSQDNLWNFLFFTGYLKKISERKDAAGENLYLTMKIPNTEVKTIYQDSISYWFDQRMKQTDRSPLLHALESGDCEAAEDFINRQLMETISYFDHAESFYHGFMAGLLTNIGGYRVKSNRESGSGRPDIVLQTPNIRKGRVIILELKLAESIADLEPAADRGLAQIEEQRYAAPFTSEGYPEVRKYAVSFYKKDCTLRKAN